MKSRTSDLASRFPKNPEILAHVVDGHTPVPVSVGAGRTPGGGLVDDNGVSGSGAGASDGGENVTIGGASGSDASGAAASDAAPDFGSPYSSGCGEAGRGERVCNHFCDSAVFLRASRLDGSMLSTA